MKDMRKWLILVSVILMITVAAGSPGFTRNALAAGENSGYSQSADNIQEDSGTDINHKVPKTGDTANLPLWTGMILLGAGILLGTVIYGKRRKAQQ